MQRIELNLAISAQEYQRFYRGQVKQVVAQALDGRTIRFPANVLQQVVQHEGIYGRFAIEFDDQGKFQRIVRLGA
ncbi:MAG: hypothetical protein COB09_11990 [Thalassobium sp.]|jgi:hypothetical protein|uniref:DUF2835 domain-containing protein n=1 Tax=Thalassolituus pacificus TaxID=2975440 RepID=A0A9X2WJ15_9GAMM|nr:DUF2835 domain-containing protein [Thalassolituus pacificus]MCT7361064.1 DUF2835 domain-containing protein [Thalassolituus pacificus]PHS62955.1 MAG: hypothetical protein COB09_11990 [Thalassobium sp.]